MTNQIELHTEEISPGSSRIMFGKKCIGEALMLEDGYYHFLPLPEHGTLAPYVLRAIAELLDELNKDWDEEVKESLGKLT